MPIPSPLVFLQGFSQSGKTTIAQAMRDRDCGVVTRQILRNAMRDAQSDELGAIEHILHRFETGYVVNQPKTSRPLIFDCEVPIKAIRALQPHHDVLVVMVYRSSHTFAEQLPGPPDCSDVLLDNDGDTDDLIGNFRAVLGSYKLGLKQARDKHASAKSTDYRPEASKVT